MKTIELPRHYPEQLGTLAHSLARAIMRLWPAMEEAAVFDLALDLVERARLRVGGCRVHARRTVAVLSLCKGDVVYEEVAHTWRSALDSVWDSQPDGWKEVAMGQLLDVFRTEAGDTNLPRGRALLQNRNDEIWKAFRGNNLEELAVRFGLCTERVRQITTSRLHEERATRQGSFGGAGFDIPT